MKTYNTNLASEFFVLASLYRLGFNAFITLGNKKSVDIIVESNNGTQLTIDVKGMKGKTSFPIDNVMESANKKSHFLIFVAFLDKMEDPSAYPEIYILPHNKVKDFVYQNPAKTRKTVNLSTLRNKGSSYKNCWRLLEK
jgi:hypothetical protein